MSLCPLVDTSFCISGPSSLFSYSVLVFSLQKRYRHTDLCSTYPWTTLFILLWRYAIAFLPLSLFVSLFCFNKYLVKVARTWVIWLLDHLAESFIEPSGIVKWLSLLPLQILHIRTGLIRHGSRVFLLLPFSHYIRNAPPLSRIYTYGYARVSVVRVPYSLFFFVTVLFCLLSNLSNMSSSTSVHGVFFRFWNSESSICTVSTSYTLTHIVLISSCDSLPYISDTPDAVSTIVTVCCIFIEV